MKRMVSFLLCLMLLTQGVCAARIGEVVDYALHTDIVAQINGHPLRSYNVNGHTAVVAEDLRGYGFRALWNPERRTLDVVWDGAVPDQWPEYTPEGAQGAVGSRARAIYATDIVTNVAGQVVESFNIGGETVIWLRDLSVYGQVSWDENARIAGLELKEIWSVNSAAYEVMQYGQDLSMKLLCEQGQVHGQQASFPGVGMYVTVGARGITINHTASMLFGEEQYLQSDYAKAYEALVALRLPRVTQENFSPDNTQQQREQAGNYFRVTLNAQPVSGNLWWSQGNNHVDLQFDFDARLYLNPGDVLEVWMGMPKQN